MLSIIPLFGSFYNIYESKYLNNEASQLFSFDLLVDLSEKTDKKKQYAKNVGEVNLLFQKHIKNISLSFIVNAVASLALDIFYGKCFFVFFAISLCLTAIDSYFTAHCYKYLQLIDEKILKYAFKIAKEFGHFQNGVLEEANRANRLLTKTAFGYVISGVFSFGSHLLGFTNVGVAIQGVSLLWNIISKKTQEGTTQAYRDDGTKEIIDYAENLLKIKYKKQDVNLDTLQKALQEKPPSFAGLFF